MKTYFLTISFLVFSIPMFAQSKEVRYGATTFNGISQASTSIEIPNADESMVAKRWASYLKDYDGKMKSRKGEYFLDNTKIASISPDTLDIYSKVDDAGDNVVVTISINRNGEYITNTTGNYTGADEILLKFATMIKKELADDEYKAADKVLKTLEKSLAVLKDKNKKLLNDIQKLKSEIADNERDIKSNEKSIDDLNAKISEQDNEVKSLKNKTDGFK
ncbi:MAG: hypothetical protein M3Q95_13030 [Bacteroidota bacterium]|nr:hypothetical protein [Bacteroidota bacterium]